MMTNIFCIDVGGTEIKYNVLSRDGELLDETRVVKTPMPPGPQSTWNMESLQEAREEYVTLVSNLVQDSKYDISGLAVSEPGFINAHTGDIQFGGSLFYMRNVNYYELFAHLGIPVVVDNDARCVAMAEKGAGAAKDLENFACITLGTGLGASIMINGKLIEGAHHRGGEFGTSIIGTSPDGIYQTFHTTASMSALIGKYCQVKGLNPHEVNGKMIFADIEDPVTSGIIDEWYEAVAQAAFNLIVTFDPEKILIGGGVSARADLADKVSEALVDLVSKSVMTDKYLQVVEMPPIETCQFRNTSGLVGAYYRFKELRGFDAE